MRDTLGDTASNYWILSTNQPYQLIASFMTIIGVLFILTGILFFASSLFSIINHLLNSVFTFVYVVFGSYYLSSAMFLYYESKSIHHDPFQEGSTCKLLSEQLAYDQCAICGSLACPQELVRIRHPFWGSSPGMFGFDGVACHHCVQRRVRLTRIIHLSIFLITFPLLIWSLMLQIMLYLIHLAGIIVFILGSIIIGIVSLSYWLGRKGKQVVTTPLAEHPEWMTPITSRLVERRIIGHKIIFRRISPSTP